MIGEITTRFLASDHQRIDIYGNDAVPFRRVRWITTSQKTRLISARLASEMRGRRAIRSLANELDVDAGDQVYAEVFEVSYRDFIFKDLCEYVFDAPNYQTKALDVFPGAEFLSAVIAYGNALVDHNVTAVREMTLGDASDSPFAEEGIEAFELDFASPGSYRVKMRGRSPVLLAAGALLAGFAIGDMRAMQVTNSGPIPVDMTAATQQLADQIVTEIGADKINQLSELHRRARDKVGFQSKARAKP